MRPILLAVHGEVYDVTDYASRHPGEGIRAIYIRWYNGKDCTDEFENFHMTDEPHAILHRALESGGDSASGVHHVCPFVFRRRIPRGLVHLDSPSDAEAYMEDKEPGTFMLAANGRRAFNFVSKCSEGVLSETAIAPATGGLWRATRDGATFDAKYPEDVVRLLCKAIGCRPAA
jgi:hypothetical protein